MEIVGLLISVLACLLAAIWFSGLSLRRIQAINRRERRL